MRKITERKRTKEKKRKLEFHVTDVTRKRNYRQVKLENMELEMDTQNEFDLREE